MIPSVLSGFQDLSSTALMATLMSLRFIPSHLLTGLEQEHFFLMTFFKSRDLGVRPVEGGECGEKPLEGR